MTFPDFLVALRKAGCEVKIAKQYSIKPPDSKKFFRLDTLGEDYSHSAIIERLSGRRIVAKHEISDGSAARKTDEYAASQKCPNLLFDIQAKIAEGAGAGYVQWIRIFNIQIAARTLIFLKENGIDSYDELCEKSAASSSEFHSRLARIKEIEARQQDISELQKQIGNYVKNRDVYAKYKASGWSQDFYEVHASEIILHRAAKKYFNELGLKKLPSINQLKQEWAALDSERRKLYSGYKAAKQKSVTLGTAKTNADVMLFGSRTPKQKHQDRDTR